MLSFYIIVLMYHIILYYSIIGISCHICYNVIFYNIIFYNILDIIIVKRYDTGLTAYTVSIAHNGC